MARVGSKGDTGNVMSLFALLYTIGIIIPAANLCLCGLWAGDIWLFMLFRSLP